MCKWWLKMALFKLCTTRIWWKLLSQFLWYICLVFNSNGNHIFFSFYFVLLFIMYPWNWFYCLLTLYWRNVLMIKKIDENLVKKLQNINYGEKCQFLCLNTVSMCLLTDRLGYCDDRPLIKHTIWAIST